MQCVGRPAAGVVEGQSIRFNADDETLRPMGRQTSGVQGMRFNDDDSLLSLNVVQEDTFLLVATSGGYAKRTAMDDYPVQGRGGKGVLTIAHDRRRGELIGALIVDLDTELYAITSGGGVIRTAAKQVRKAGRQTRGAPDEHRRGHHRHRDRPKRRRTRGRTAVTPAVGRCRSRPTVTTTSGTTTSGTTTRGPPPRGRHYGRHPLGRICRARTELPASLDREQSCAARTQPDDLRVRTEVSTPNEPDKTPNAGASGPTRGAVVQPWHRGQGESGGSRTQTAP